MRKFNYNTKWKILLTPEIVTMLTAIHEFKGEQKLLIETQNNTINRLEEIAKTQSIEASNKIEGIFTSDVRFKKLVANKMNPKSRNEQEIAGYRDSLATINENYNFLPIRPSIIMQLHRDLYKFSGKSIGGAYKTANNIINEEGIGKNQVVNLESISTSEIPSAIEELCMVFDDVLSQSNADPLLIIPMFIIDFLCIQPFNDGNERMSRLLTLLFLYRAGYTVGKYISIEKIIETSKDTYYEAIQSSSNGWHEDKNDYSHFVRYMLSVILAAYCEFSSSIQVLTISAMSKPERICKVIKDNLGEITKAEIMINCPDISQVTVQRTLNDLLKNGDIIKIGGGRYTSYIWNKEKE